MSAPGAHLLPEFRTALTLPREERIYVIRKGSWIEYPRATEVLTMIEDTFKQPYTERIDNILLVGESGNGKTRILEEFRRRHPITQNEDGTARIPVVSMDMPVKSDETRFWSRLLDALKIAHRRTERATVKEAQAIEVLIHVRARMLIIDEIHNMLEGGPNMQRAFLATLKGLSNQLGLPIVCAGTRNSIRALHTDQEVSSRYMTVGLKRWKLDKNYLRLLASFEQRIPLAEPSNLASKEIAPKLLSMSEGTIGGTFNVIKHCAARALRKNRERIVPEDLDEIDYIPLSQYGRQAEEL